MKKDIKILLIGLLLPIFLQAQPKHEIRAVWLTSLYNLDWPTTRATNARTMQRQQRELCDMLDRLAAANFNTVIFQTRLRGDVVYPSAIEPFDECLTGTAGKSPGYDPLRFAIDECHKRNMELHAWVVAIPLGATSQAKSLGKRSVTRRYPQLCKRYQNHWYMDPGHPDTQYYLSRLVMEIVDNYDIDGIHLDYIRYPEKAEHFPDADTYRRYGRGEDKAAWRRNNITAIVRNIYQSVKLKKPWVKVSSSPVGKYSDTQRYASKGWNALHAVHQDARLWLKEGINDILFPMMYFKDNNFYPFALDWNENKYGRFIVPGLGIYFLDPHEGNWQLNDVMQQVKFVRDQKLDGLSFFRARYIIGNTRNLTDETTRSFFNYPAFVPTMTWADSIAPEAPCVHPIIANDKTVSLSWDIPVSNDTTSIRYRIYAANQYPVDTEKPQHIVCTGTSQASFTLPRTNSQANRLYWAVTAVDRYGNESPGSAFNAPDHPWNNIYTTLNLSEMPEIIISTIAGKEIMRLSTHDDVRLEQLPKGIYRLSSIDASGQHTDRGIMIR